ncbi:hypothetical protein SAMN05880501_11080 [Ureibacillus xyleni]|uniref:Tumor necrosis factor receptor superfamily member 19 n=1 Tax=Ureibacillus xyleni TaxID=614648 RepID=A0A285TA04_9BACL|nr:hypothetical protein [Ureibacillus xyleni]SOC18307.1 hypothetical protein SAMN05880501_11080 [Ureibacillus xyleni]
MNGKKAALYLLGAIILAAILVTIAMQVFFRTYEPKNPGEMSFEVQVNENAER